MDVLGQIIADPLGLSASTLILAMWGAFLWFLRKFVASVEQLTTGVNVASAKLEAAIHDEGRKTRECIHGRFKEQNEAIAEWRLATSADIAHIKARVNGKT